MAKTYRVNLKLSYAEWRNLRGLSRSTGETMTGLLMRGLGYVDSAEKLKDLQSGDDVPDTRFLDTLPHKE